MPRPQIYDSPKRLTIVLEEKNFDFVQKVSKKKGVSMSNLMNLLVQKLMRDNPAKPAPPVDAKATKVKKS